MRALFEVFDQPKVALAQRETQYAHLARSLYEGCDLDAAKLLVRLWRLALTRRELDEEIALDVDVLTRVCPLLAD
jgi:hypothetical protein